MAEATNIEWADSTFNPWMGCTKVSPACDHCYAETLMDKRHGKVTWGPHGERVRTSASNWQNPRRWQRQAAAFLAEHGRRRRVFCASLADVFDNQVPAEWRADLWDLIRETPDLDWLLLTKRPQNIAKMLPTFWPGVAGHVWLGTSTENQEEADRRLPHLLAIDPRPAVFFASAEPLLGPIDFQEAWDGDSALDSECWGDCAWCSSGKRPLHDCQRGRQSGDDRERGRSGLDWIIAGGESGPGARPTHPGWVRLIRDECATAGVAFLFKQWGGWHPWEQRLADGNFNLLSFGKDPARYQHMASGVIVSRVGKKAAGRFLDGVTHDAFPTAIAVGTAAERGTPEIIFHAMPDPDACRHQWGGWRDFEDGNGGEQVCKLCGMGAMSYSLRTGP